MLSGSKEHGFAHAVKLFVDGQYAGHVDGQTQQINVALVKSARLPTKDATGELKIAATPSRAAVSLPEHRHPADPDLRARVAFRLIVGSQRSFQ